MEPNEGQRRVDSRDGWAPFVVRPAYRRDPDREAHINVFLSVLALVAIGLVFGAVVYWARLPMLNTIFQTLPIVTPWTVMLP